MHLIPQSISLSQIILMPIISDQLSRLTVQEKPPFRVELKPTKSERIRNFVIKDIALFIINTCINLIAMRVINIPKQRIIDYDFLLYTGFRSPRCNFQICPQRFHLFSGSIAYFIFKNNFHRRISIVTDQRGNLHNRFFLCHFRCTNIYSRRRIIICRQMYLIDKHQVNISINASIKGKIRRQRRYIRIIPVIYFYSKNIFLSIIKETADIKIKSGISPYMFTHIKSVYIKFHDLIRPLKNNNRTLIFPGLIYKYRFPIPRRTSVISRDLIISVKIIPSMRNIYGFPRAIISSDILRIKRRSRTKLPSVIYRIDCSYSG